MMAEGGEPASFLAYSSIGFEKTCTEAFDDLKAEQISLSTRVDGIVGLFYDLRAKIDGGQELNASLRTSLSQYSEAREDLVDAIMIWYEKSGITIAENVDPRSKRRVKRVHDFVENMKRELRKMKGVENR